jgi:hypothetical protein
MKCFLLLILGAAGAFAQTAGMRQVYLMPMSGGLDQYLATWLTSEHVMQVVTDPKTADVVLTDRIGASFEQKLSELYPPEKAAVEKDDKKSADKTPTTAGAGDASGARHDFRTIAARGTVFLVDTKTHRVVWSDQENPVDPTDAKLNREAERIVRKLSSPSESRDTSRPAGR